MQVKDLLDTVHHQSIHLERPIAPITSAITIPSVGLPRIMLAEVAGYTSISPLEISAWYTISWLIARSGDVELGVALCDRINVTTYGLSCQSRRATENRGNERSRVQDNEFLGDVSILSGGQQREGETNEFVFKKTVHPQLINASATRLQANRVSRST